MADSKNTPSIGVIHLEHQRARPSRVEGLFDRYHGLVIEKCSNDAQRIGYGILAIYVIQSTSHQQDPKLYAATAAAAPTAVTSEQPVTWAYPQPEWNDELNALTVVNSLLGSIHLSGRLDLLGPHQYDLIVKGMEVNKSIGHNMKIAHSFWPLDLPRWHDHWICLGMDLESHLYLTVWRRGGVREVKMLVIQADVKLRISSSSKRSLDGR